MRQVALLLLSLGVQRLAGQAPPRYAVQRLDGALFLEQLHTDVTAQSGSAEVQRTVVRTAQFSFAVREDTLVVTADTVDLRETANGAQRTIDVDPVIGARWKILIGTRGTVTVADEPVVTRDIADVSDVSTAMNDFFPIAPPLVAVRGTATDTTHRVWHRLADSAGCQRYHVTQLGHDATTRAVGDSVAVRSTEDVTEDADVVWDLARGPVAWTRRVNTTVTSHFSGRTNRAVVEQRITVRRIR